MLTPNSTFQRAHTNSLKADKSYSPIASPTVSSAQLLRPLLRRFPASSSLHQSKGTKPPPCIMHAHMDLIETENVMIHSGALLIGQLSETRRVRQLQTRAMGVNES